MSKYSSRKFWTMVVFEAAFYLAYVLDKMPDEVFVSLTWLCLGGYLGANIAQHIWGKK